LIDEGMAEIQGKALWVYNNALFHENDFENILKLGGKTKLQEKDKIGKFGLGFCSVYNEEICL
jgi:sacsin